MFIQDSRRSYRTYTYTDLCLFRTPVGVSELILITDLCGFRTPVGVTELRLMLQSLNLFEGTCRYHRDYGKYIGLTELILVLQNLLLYFGYRSTRRYYRTFYWYKSTRRCYITDSLYGGTRRYHWTHTYLTDTEVLVGTTELLLIY